MIVPRLGAITGATPFTCAIAVRKSRDWRASNRSRTIARGRIPTAPAPTPWIRRRPSSRPIDGANAAPSPHKVKMRSPTTSAGLRPKRSASGPTKSGAVEKPARKIATVAAACVWVVARPAWTNARLGSAMSIASGGSAVIVERKTRKPRPWISKDGTPDSERAPPRCARRSFYDSTPGRNQAT